QDAVGGSFAASGATVTVTVSHGPEPVSEEASGGHFSPQKDYRPELDEKRVRDERELRERIEGAAGSNAAGGESEPEPELAAQVADVKGQLQTLAEVAFAPEQPTTRELAAAQERVDRAIEKAADDLIVQVADVLTDLINEIAEDSD